MVGLPRTLNSITIVMHRYAEQRELRRFDVGHPDGAMPPMGKFCFGEVTSNSSPIPICHSATAPPRAHHSPASSPFQNMRQRSTA